MSELPEIYRGVQEFAIQLRKLNISILNNTSLNRVVEAIVRHSNGLQFVDEAALPPKTGNEYQICYQVRKLVTGLQNELSVTSQVQGSEGNFGDDLRLGRRSSC
jgi:hypothetical protein